MTQDAYKKSGVDIAAGEAAVEKIAALTGNAEDKNVLSAIGGFGALYALPTNLKEPVLVSGTDGVGTKLLVAIAAGQSTTIGEDLVAMCVNDILAQGAVPLFFLDYLGIHHVDPDAVSDIVAGVQSGCQKGQLALIGGETAEMPDMYAQDHYDLAGFAVGLADKSRLLVPEKVQAGDEIIGLPSSGIHSNGYSLVRQLVFKQHDYQLDDVVPQLGVSVAEALLTPTRIYTAALKPLLAQNLMAGAAHITGGGLVENLPRALPNGLAAKLDWSSWQVPPIFHWLQQLGDLSTEDMLQTFNLGIGFTIIAHPQQAKAVKSALTAAGEVYYHLGVVQEKQSAAIEFVGRSQV